jgi:hypothetical protein
MHRFSKCAVAIAVGLVVGFDVRPAASGSEKLPACSCQCERRGDWTVAESTNFSVWIRRELDVSRDLALCCESLRDRLASAWTGSEQVATWSPRCVVVVHDTPGAYQLAVEAGDESAGCTTVTSEQDRIIFRRIDIRGDLDNWQSDALPHELTHVVLADQFLECRVDVWFNEGAAMLSESQSLQSQRLALLERERAQGTLPRISQLVDDIGHLDPNLRYAASFSLVQFRDQQGGRKRLLEFAQQMRQAGHDQSLRDLFSIEGGIAELEHQWHSSLGRHQRTLAER